MKEKRSMRKVMMTTMLVTAGILMIGGTSSKAALQANMTTHNAKAGKKGAQWIEQIRQMETSGQTMGLNETLATDLTPSSASNNIDVHMMKTTEYGAVAILSASGFGNPKKLSEVSIKSSTGNVTGVYMGDRWEWTAGVADASIVGKNARYYDLYTQANTSAKAGDALGTADTINKGCAGWHGSINSSWLVGTERGFVRGGDGGLFSFSGRYNSSGTNVAQWHMHLQCGRGVAVVGTGL